MNNNNPQTPPPSTHRVEVPISPETPTHQPLTIDSGASLFNAVTPPQQPTTPVLYNLIRNEGPPKFIPVGGPKEISEVEDLETGFAGEEGEDSMLRGHPSACLFVARYCSPYSYPCFFGSTCSTSSLHLNPPETPFIVYFTFTIGLSFRVSLTKV